MKKKAEAGAKKKAEEEARTAEAERLRLERIRIAEEERLAVEAEKQRVLEARRAAAARKEAERLRRLQNIPSLEPLDPALVEGRLSVGEAGPAEDGNVTMDVAFPGSPNRREGSAVRLDPVRCKAGGRKPKRGVPDNTRRDLSRELVRSAMRRDLSYSGGWKITASAGATVLTADEFGGQVVDIDIPEGAGVTLRF